MSDKKELYDFIEKQNNIIFKLQQRVDKHYTCFCEKINELEEELEELKKVKININE